MSIFDSFQILAGLANADNDIEKRVLIKLLSQVSGILSVALWLFVKIPQILENYLNKSVDGVSWYFLSIWIAGDVFNLVGCIVTGALPFQICISVYYCFIDMILTIQYWYYTSIYPYQRVEHNLLESPTMTRGLEDRVHASDISRTNRFEQELNSSSINRPIPSFKSENQHSLFGKFLKASVVASSMTGQVAAFPVSLRQEGTNPGEEPERSLVQLILHGLRHLNPFALFFNERIGVSLVWFCSLLYISSRLPQIYQNYKRHSTKGVSPFLFLLALLANTFYAMSIGLELYLLYGQTVPGEIGDEFHKVFLTEKPFLIRSSGTVVFDIFLLFQYRYYNGQSQSRNRVDNGDDFLRNDRETSSGMVATNSKESNIQVRETPFAFTKPSWYTNNHHEAFSDEQRNPTADLRRDSMAKNRHDENTSLLSNYHEYYNSMVSPPQHYVSAGTFQNTYNTPSGIGSAISNKLSFIARSFSENNSFAQPKSPMSPSSMLSSYQGHHGSPPANTALIPSIVESYSSIGKKMSQDTKVPFSPSDFLVDKLYRSNDAE